MSTLTCDKQSQAAALDQLANHNADSTESVRDLVAAAKAPTTAHAAAVATASQAPKPEPPKTVAEARARSQRGLELLTNVIHVLEDASRTVHLSGKHTRSAIDHTFKQAYIKLTTACENITRASDSITATNNRMAKANKTIETAGSAGVDPEQLAEIKSLLAAIRAKVDKRPEQIEAPDLSGLSESLAEFKDALEANSSTANSQALQTAKDVRNIATVVENRTGKLTLLITVSLACSVFAALCAFGGVLAMLLRGN